MISRNSSYIKNKTTTYFNIFFYEGSLSSWSIYQVTFVRTAGLKVHRIPLRYPTSISWSSSIPMTVPVLLRHSNMPSVQPPWPCCRDWTISRSRSMFTYNETQSYISATSFFLRWKCYRQVQWQSITVQAHLKINMYIS